MIIKNIANLPVRHLVLEAIDAHGPMSHKELSVALSLTQSYMNCVVNAMREVGDLVPVGTVPREEGKRGASTWRWGRKNVVPSYEDRVALLEAKVKILEQALLYGMGSG